MKIEINIQTKHALIILLFITAASAIGIAGGYGGTAPATMGHTLSEVNLSAPATFGGTITVDEGLSPSQALTINSNQIWKSVTTGDKNLYLQYNTEGGHVVIGDNVGAANHLYVQGSADVRDYVIGRTGLCIGSDCRTGWQPYSTFAVRTCSVGVSVAPSCTASCLPDEYLLSGGISAGAAVNEMFGVVSVPSAVGKGGSWYCSAVVVGTLTCYAYCAK